MILLENVVLFTLFKDITGTKKLVAVSFGLLLKFLGTNNCVTLQLILVELNSRKSNSFGNLNLR